jgi:hypothetical protein
MFIDFPVSLKFALSISSTVLRVSLSAVVAVEVFTITLARGSYQVLPYSARWVKVF